MENYETLEGLKVNVDRVEQVEGAQTPPDRPYQFNYHITIHNETPHVVTIVGRKWVVTNAKGHRLIVEGDGVVGQFPRLTPGDRFRYNSYHLIDCDSVAEGAYLGKIEDSNGNEKPIIVKVASFEMKIQ